MSVLGKVVLCFGMLFANTDTSDLTSDISENEQIYSESEIVENNNVSDTDTSISEEEQSELVELLNKWLNGELELDEATLQKLYDKLEVVTEEQVNKTLEKYIEDSEERQKVSGIIMAVLGALLSFLAMTIYLKKIKNQGAVATLNNESFSKSSKLIKEQVAESKKDIADIKKVIEDDRTLREKSDELIKKSMEQMQKQFEGIIGVLKITYNVGDENESEEQKEESSK